MSEYENIVLDYHVVIKCEDGEGATTIYFADRCEFFMDEHNIQWVKFIPANGYDRGKEHMKRTDCDGFTVVRDDR